MSPDSMIDISLSPPRSPFEIPFWGDILRILCVVAAIWLPLWTVPILLLLGSWLFIVVGPPSGSREADEVGADLVLTESEYLMLKYLSHADTAACRQNTHDLFVEPSPDEWQEESSDTVLSPTPFWPRDEPADTSSNAWPGSPSPPGSVGHYHELLQLLGAFELLSHLLSNAAVFLEKLSGVLQFDDQLTSALFVQTVCISALGLSVLIYQNLLGVTFRAALALWILAPWCEAFFLKPWLGWEWSDVVPTWACRLIANLPDGPEQTHRRLCRKYG